MDSKTKHICIVAAYLTICIIILLTLLCYLWPTRSTYIPKDMDTNKPAAQTLNPEQNNNKVGEPNETEQPDPNEPAVQITDPNRNDNDVNEPMETEISDPNSQKPNAEVTLRPMSYLRIMGLVLIMGALGACLHGITSLAYHCARKKFTHDWTLWYFYRPFVGGILALIFYLIISGGLVSQVNGNNGKFFRLLGLSGMIGLFSRQALIRLGEIFKAVFGIVEDEKPNNTV